MLKSKVTEEGVYLHKNSIFDALGLSTLYDYDYFKEDQDYYLLDDVLRDFQEKYSFDVQKNETSYMISYKHL